MQCTPRVQCYVSLPYVGEDIAYVAEMARGDDVVSRHAQQAETERSGEQFPPPNGRSASTDQQGNT